MRPLAQFIVEHGSFKEALVDHLRTSEEQEERIRQYVAKIVAIGTPAPNITILMDMVETIAHATLVIQMANDSLTLTAQSHYPDHAMAQLYQLFVDKLPKTTEKAPANIPITRREATREQ